MPGSDLRPHIILPAISRGETIDGHVPTFADRLAFDIGRTMRDRDSGSSTMTIASWTGREGAGGRSFASATPGMGRGLLLAALAAGALWAAHSTNSAATAEAVSNAGKDLTRLLRFMALIKATMAAGVLLAVWWRLAVPATLGWLVAYLACGAGMAAGPVLIWDMAHVGLGALLLHGGLFAALVMLWRDPAVAVRLDAMATARRRTPTGRAGGAEDQPSVTVHRR